MIKSNRKMLKTIVSSFCFVLIYYSSAFGLEFKEVDYVKMLISHPLYENYNPETGRFKDTHSEIIEIPVLEKQIRDLYEVAKKLKEEKGSFVENSMIFAMDSDENTSWDEIAKIDQELSKVEAEIERLEKLWEEGGVPDQNSITAVVNEITDDIKSQINDLSGPDTIVLNKLPAYTEHLAMPTFNNRFGGYGHFLKERDKDSLKVYLEHSYGLSLYFESTADVILYQKGEEK